MDDNRLVRSYTKRRGEILSDGLEDYWPKYTAEVRSVGFFSHRKPNPSPNSGKLVRIPKSLGPLDGHVSTAVAAQPSCNPLSLSGQRY